MSPNKEAYQTRKKKKKEKRKPNWPCISFINSISFLSFYTSFGGSSHSKLLEIYIYMYMYIWWKRKQWMESWNGSLLFLLLPFDLLDIISASLQLGSSVEKSSRTVPICRFPLEYNYYHPSCCVVLCCTVLYCSAIKQSTTEIPRDTQDSLSGQCNREHLMAVCSFGYQQWAKSFLYAKLEVD